MECLDPLAETCLIHNVGLPSSCKEHASIILSVCTCDSGYETSVVDDVSTCVLETIECDPSCLTCDASGPNGCTTCLAPRRFNDGTKACDCDLPAFLNADNCECPSGSTVLNSFTGTFDNLSCSIEGCESCTESAGETVCNYCTVLGVLGVGETGEIACLDCSSALVNDSRCPEPVKFNFDAPENIDSSVKELKINFDNPLPPSIDVNMLLGIVEVEKVTNSTNVYKIEFENVKFEDNQFLTLTMPENALSTSNPSTSNVEMRLNIRASLISFDSVIPSERRILSSGSPYSNVVYTKSSSSSTPVAQIATPEDTIVE